MHCHIAEKIERAYPGKRNVDFRPFFSAMKKIGYTGKISMECKWWNFDSELGGAKKYLDQQIVESYW